MSRRRGVALPEESDTFLKCEDGCLRGSIPKTERRRLTTIGELGYKREAQ